MSADWRQRRCPSSYRVIGTSPLCLPPIQYWKPSPPSNPCGPHLFPLRPATPSLWHHFFSRSQFVFFCAYLFTVLVDAELRPQWLTAPEERVRHRVSCSSLCYISAVSQTDDNTHKGGDDFPDLVQTTHKGARHSLRAEALL